MEQRRSYSQSGEDLLLADIFGESVGTMVDVGAHDGIHLSNSYLLESMGWKCILVEPNPELYDKICRQRKAQAFQCAATAIDGEVAFHISPDADAFSTMELTEENAKKFETMHARVERTVVHGRKLDSILEETNAGKIDVVSIDVEGHELSVFQGFTITRWNPRVVIVEGNSTKETRAISKVLASSGYVRFHRSGCNDWYAKPDDRQLVNFEARMRTWISDADRFTRDLLRPILPMPVRKLLRRRVLAPAN